MSSKKTTEPKTVTEPVTTTKTVDVTPIINAMPETFTPATLDKCFNLNDGGKTVRRHLRKHFAETMAHAHNDKWAFTKTANADILAYFAARYAFNPDALAAK